jgi:hypothetical protein
MIKASSENSHGIRSDKFMKKNQFQKILILIKYSCKNIKIMTENCDY